ncbi:MAG: phosphatidate cytidylyltransferase [Oscillospiraceae bacterium]|jgi:phosphatidate cytidylyltransferase|nr:phosphatidate cytidylyltransferase [Oscillospiraceae bacterium]
MARRIISAGVAIPIGIFILAVDNKELVITACAVVSVAAVYEILLATKYLQNRVITALSLIFVFLAPFVLNYDFFNTRYVAFVFIIGLFLIMLFKYKEVKLAEVALVAFVSICIPFSLASIGFFYNADPEHFGAYSAHRTFCVVYALTITWISDAGAYFVGTLAGKHKMAPDISPKKTWEGFFGGMVTAALFGVLLGKGYELWEFLFTGANTFKTDTMFLAGTALCCSLLGVLGDLSASLIKRECSVKDFGNIMPGHGGVLDRFDSVLFVVPFVYLVFLRYFPVTDKII